MSVMYTASIHDLHDRRDLALISVVHIVASVLHYFFIFFLLHKSYVMRIIPEEGRNGYDERSRDFYEVPEASQKFWFVPKHWNI
jgi:hypothetical protein